MKELIFIGICLIAFGCISEESTSQNEQSGEQNITLWSIPLDEVLDGGPGKDAFFKASNGNEYSITGSTLAGPNQGSTMEISTGVVSFWFAVAAFYPNPAIYIE